MRPSAYSIAQKAGEIPENRVTVIQQMLSLGGDFCARQPFLHSP